MTMPLDSSNWVDISSFLGLKKGEMAEFDYEDKKNNDRKHQG
jgi:hypothetical protein